MRPLTSVLLFSVLLAITPACKKRGAEPGAPASAIPVPDGPPVNVVKPDDTIGRTMPVVTGWKDADGRIDYPGAIHELLSKGVTTTNNANVALWELLGPTAPDGSKPSAAYFQKLGMPPPLATGAYFVGAKQFGSTPAGNGWTGESVAKLTGHPWSARDDETAATWLQANEKPLAALRSAVTRTHYYNPILPERGEKGSKGLFSALLPGTQGHRELATALAARAMLYSGQGNHAEAWQDLLACHRLGRLVGRGGTLIEGLVGMAIEQIACRGECAFLAHAPSDPQLIERCLRELAALPSTRTVADHLVIERFALLDVFVQIDKQGLDFITAIGGAEPHPLAGFIIDGTDWEPAFLTANRWFDRLVECAREKDLLTRTAKFDSFTRDIRALAARAKDMPRVSKELLESEEPGKARGQAMGELMVSLVLPAADKIVEADYRVRQSYETVLAAYALGWHQCVTGRYPETLAQLAPGYLTTVPGDVFSGKELIYQPHPAGFVLYSVGSNGADDGARDRDSNPPGDDIVVRIPLATRP